MFQQIYGAMWPCRDGRSWLIVSLDLSSQQEFQGSGRWKSLRNLAQSPQTLGTERDGEIPEVQDSGILTRHRIFYRKTGSSSHFFDGSNSKINLMVRRSQMILSHREDGLKGIEQMQSSYSGTIDRILGQFHWLLLGPISSETRRFRLANVGGPIGLDGKFGDIQGSLQIQILSPLATLHPKHLAMMSLLAMMLLHP
ncbi:hypothetical protein EUTSA_v10011994mg [Eutrema salsugineum]|uniref:Uncharacterized protein n=1 Tax=Eutrema salsugineum TaxID=72664 RepID=V4KHX2_EUTSA|nr:hypothetical protein EUTSA_v10011994mg [Eutrema salsugineum]